jgi:uncharacterized protein involved in exopolysaccharide biosynthesis
MTQEEEVPLIVLVNVLLRNAPLTLGIPILLFLLIVGYGLLQPRSYTADARFMPESAAGGAAGRLPGLAAQFGVDLPSGGGESLDFYMQLLRSRHLLGQAAVTNYSVKLSDDRTASVPLTRLYVEEPAQPDDALRETVERLRDDVTARADSRAGTINLTTRAPSATLAVQLNRRLIELLNEYNVQTRQSRGRAEREFVEARIRESALELREAERQLERFLEQNRLYESSPTLRFEASRLERSVNLHQQLHNTLLQSYERARLAEIRDIPVITVIDWPEGSEQVAGRGLFGRGLLALILGGLVGLGAAFGREYAIRDRRRNPGAYAQFDYLRHGTLRRLVPGWIPARRVKVPAGTPESDGVALEPANGMDREREPVHDR